MVDGLINLTKDRDMWMKGWCEQWNKPSVSINCEHLLGYLKKYSSLKYKVIVKRKYDSFAKSL